MIGDEDLIFRVEPPFKAWVAGRVVFGGPMPPAETLAALRVGMNWVRFRGQTGWFIPDKVRRRGVGIVLKKLPEEYMVKSISDGSGSLLNEPVKVNLSFPSREILVTLEYKTAAPPGTN